MQIYAQMLKLILYLFDLSTTLLLNSTYIMTQDAS